MRVRFIFGRAGTGKTWYCLESVRAQLRIDPLNGPPLLLLVPEQATFQTERALLTPDIPVSHRAEVLSFQRLAFRVLESRGITPGQALSESARAMVLRHLLQKRREQLRYYRRVERNAGFIDRLAETITEFIAQSVEPADLLSDPDNPPDDPRQADKLHDLSLLYEEYLSFLGDDRVDASQYFELATREVPHCPWLRGGLLYMDGFAGLTQRETLLLTALARQCANTAITVLLDPELVSTPALRRNLPAARLFRKTHETWLDLHESLARAGLFVEQPLLLTPDTPPRFARCQTLAQLEKVVFAPQGMPPPVDSNSEPPVELVQWPTQRLEVQYAVSRILHWVSGAAPWRYRDVAILVRDLEVYHDLLVSELSAHGIPFFVDRRRPIAHHPLIELLRGGIALLNDRFSLDAVRLVLKTGLLGLDRDAVDELENYLLAHGIEGPAAWFGDDWKHLRRDAYVRRTEEIEAAPPAALARINHTRRQFVEAVRPLEGDALISAVTGAEWARRLRDWIAALGVADSLQRWMTTAEESGDLDLAAQHRQIGRDIHAFLDDLEFALPDLPLPVEEFSGILDQGLSGLTLGLTPPTLDQILIGAVERSRQPTLKGVIFLGFNEGQFPRVPVEGSVLNDDDREALRARGLRVAPPTRLQSLDESLLVYIALTRASHRLVISCAAAGEDGKELRPSPYFADIEAALSGVSRQFRANPQRSGETWDVMNQRDLASRLALEMRRPASASATDENRARWHAIYERALPVLAPDRAARHAFSALAPLRPVRVLSQATSLPILREDAQTRQDVLVTSVSALESYAACPFQYLARHVLRLRERRESALAAVDVGQLRHAILEEFFNDLIAQRRSLATLEDVQLEEQLLASCCRAAKRLVASGLLAQGKDAHALRGTRRDLARFLRGQRDLARVSRLHPHATELSFGFDDGGLPPFDLPLGAGRPILRLRGFIDRVDMGLIDGQWLGAVYDYKETRDKKLEVSRVLHGLALQLPVYLVVLRAQGGQLVQPGESPPPVQPVAALFISLAQPYRTVSRENGAPDDGSSPDEGQSAMDAKPRGLIDFDRRLALDGTHTAKWSNYFQMYADGDGDCGYENRSDAAPAQLFSAVLDYVQGKLKDLGTAMLSGDFDIHPVRLGTWSPCTWCSMRGLCRMEIGLNEVRYLESLSRPDALRAMTR